MERRSFMKAVVGAIQGVIGLVVAVPGLRYLLDPLRRRNDESRSIRLIPLSALPGDRPLRVHVSADRWDAYTHHPPGPIGSVFLVREGADGEDPRVRCLQTICPHLGCGIDYLTDRDVFACPCHASEFDQTGLIRYGPSPRSMDELVCRVTGADERNRRWIEVEYVEFQTGIPTKRPIV